MKLTIRVATASCALWLLAGILAAEEPADRAPARQTIEIGQPLADAQAALRDHHIKFGENDLQLIPGDEDIEYLSCTLDESSAWAVIYYSKAKKTVTSISFYCSNHGGQKADRVWLPAKSISLESDGGYSVRFPPAAKEKKDQPPK